MPFNSTSTLQETAWPAAAVMQYLRLLLILIRKHAAGCTWSSVVNSFDLVMLCGPLQASVTVSRFVSGLPDWSLIYMIQRQPQALVVRDLCWIVSLGWNSCMAECTERKIFRPGSDHSRVTQLRYTLRQVNDLVHNSGLRQSSF